MKKVFVYLLIGGGFMIASCNNDKRVEKEVIGTDTVGTEYDVEKKVREKTIDVDTVTKDTTIERGTEK